MLILSDDSNIRIEDLNLDFYLTATPISGGISKDMSGRKTYVIDAYKENQGFGITSIDIDVKPNLQPVVTIVFKDLYGKLLFNKDDKFPFELLFQLPYPKFRLYVKGYLGKAVNFLLQVKSTQTTFQPSDGSYEIKAEFVPNVFGFFGDIPYQYLFAVRELKNLLGDAKGSQNDSIIDIAKIGAEVSTKVSQVKDKYGPLKSQLTLLSSGYIALANAFKEEKLKFDSIAGDSDLIAKGFKPIQFNLIYKDSAGKLLNKIKDSDLEAIGKTIYLSINSTTQLDLSKPVSTLNAYNSTNDAKKQEAFVKKLLSDNDKAAQDATAQQAYATVEDRLIDTQSIYNVMTRLAGDCAYILGYILEGGIAGFNKDATRLTDERLIGNYYPLIENPQSDTNVAILGGQIPNGDLKTPNSTPELKQVEQFVKALYTGRQYAEKVIEETTVQDTGGAGGIDDSPPPIPVDLKRKLSNMEYGGKSPYYASAESIIVNIIQRSGLIAAGFAGSFYNANNNNHAIKEIVNSEVDNIVEHVNQLKSKEKETLKKFCTVINEKFDVNGKFKDTTKSDRDNWGTATSVGPSVRDFIAQYFNKFPKASTEKGQFSGGDYKSLKSIYTYNNNILYHSPTSLKAAFDSAVNSTIQTNNILSAPYGEILGYVSSDAEITALENLFNKDEKGNYDPNNTTFNTFEADPTILYNNPANYFYQTFKATGRTSDVQEKCIFIDVLKMFGEQKSITNPDGTVSTGGFESKYYSPTSMIVKHSKSGNFGSKPKPNDYIFRILDTKSTGSININDVKGYAVDCYDQSTLAYLASICYTLLTDTKRSYLSLTDKELKAQQLKDAQQAAVQNGAGGSGAYVSMEPVVQKPREYQRDLNEISAVYTQFHHICQAWVALANTSVEAFTGEKGLPTGTDPNTLNLRNSLERVYRNDQTGDRSFFYLNFNFPLLSDANPNFDIRDAIINSDPLLVNNTDTSTLNMMTAICQKNNFILQPIPGGVTDNIDEIFLAHPETDTAIGGNALSIIWSPTPENRVSKNNSEDSIYPETGWFDILRKITKPVIALQYGKPNNAIVKSIKAGTDDNKITSESLQATNDIVNNTNPNKVKSFDCSMLAVLQGRSYKISIDLIGNAQLYPTQLVAVDGLPIFKGLYWITEVTHKITPNNMETTIDALKMKYKGDGKFAAVLPVTKRGVRGGTYQGNYNVNGTEGLGYSGDLNYKFLQLVKDKKITKTDDLNPIIKEFTKSKYNDFVTWFNAEIAGNKKPLCAAKINADNFKKVWDFLIPTVWTDYGSSGCNFLEFVALHAIIYEETGGTYESKHEGMNDVKNLEHPGIAYAYDAYQLPATNGKAARDKSSYNKAPNKTAGELFNDPSYIEAFKNLKFGTDPKVVRSNDPAWKGTNFPKSLFSNVEEAVTTDPTFISQADFYKYAGRGFIGSTWRSQYQEIVKFILTYSGSDPIVRKYQGNWKAAPFNGNEETILIKSTNANWDELFTSGAIQGYAIYNHASSSKYQYMNPLTKPKEELIKNIEKEAKKVNASDDYQRVHRTRVYVILDTLYPEGATASGAVDPNATFSYAPPNVEGALSPDGKCTSVKRGNNFIYIHTGKEKQFYKREVRSITLHYTAGYGRNAQDTVDHVGACGGKYQRGGIHYAIDWQGGIAKGIPEDIISVHGDNWNAHGIGIEMCNLGKMEPRPDKGVGDNGKPIFYSPAGQRFHYEGQKFMGSIMPPIADLGFIWHRYQYYQEYTDSQINALEKVIKDIFTRYPKIQQAIQGKDLWATTFRAIDGRPAPGSTPQIPKYPHANMKDYGIFTHWSNSGGTHTDSAPTPKLVALLKKLGMTG